MPTSYTMLSYTSTEPGIVLCNDNPHPLLKGKTQSKRHNSHDKPLLIVGGSGVPFLLIVRIQLLLFLKIKLIAKRTSFTQQFKDGLRTQFYCVFKGGLSLRPTAVK